MSVCLSALFAVLLPASALQPPPGPPRGQATREALKPFQGTWTFESLEEDGMKVTADELKQRTIFFGADVFVVRQGNKILQAGGLQVNPSKNPKSVNAMVKVGQDKGKVWLGIYALDGDTLKLCLDTEGEERPKEFKAPAGSKRLLAVCKRVKRKNENLEIAGTYRSEAIQDDGSKYVAEAIIERLGDAYLVTYKKGPLTAYIAVGIRHGDTFCIAWANQGQVGVTLYKIEPGPRLVGQYTHLGGAGMLNQETLTKARKTIDARLR
jgi:uncharacterized protein (TIGR03067 family)